MDLYVLDTNLNDIAIIDSYKSLIWTDRYNEYGDFEIYTPMADGILSHIKQDYYLQRAESEHVMIVEKILINSDAEDGDVLTVSGRSLESILDRRIVWGQKSLSGSLQTAIQTLLNENIISPSKAERKIDNFIFEASTDPAITDLTIEAQYTGDNLYDVITALCAERGIGFKVTLNSSKQFVFKLYAGSDRSYEQTENPYVVFSPNFDNIISSNYMESKQALKNVTLVGGEGEGSERKYTAVGNVSGLNRREIFTDARDISSTDEDGGTVSDADYTAQLRQRGKETLAENRDIVSFEGEAETTIMFKYGVDFFNGDIVQVADNYGHEGTARVTEIVTSDDENGITVYPTFEMIEATTLPEGYLELEYIQSSGTQHIDTGFKPNQNSKVEVTFQTAQTTSGGIAISDTNWGSAGFGIWVNAAAFGSNTNQDVVFYGANKITAILDKGVLYKDGVQVWSVTAEAFQTVGNMTLMCLNRNNTKSEYLTGKLYSCKIYDDDVLVRNFVPCKNENDVIGLYDLVGEQFYANAGTGAFTTG